MYRFVTYGPGGSTADSAFVRVTDPLPVEPLPEPPQTEATISASVTSAAPGDQITFTVRSSNADTGLLLPTGAWRTNGEITVTLDATTTYYFIASGSGGLATDSVEVTMIGGRPEPATPDTVWMAPDELPAGYAVRRVVGNRTDSGLVVTIKVAALTAALPVKPDTTTSFQLDLTGSADPESDSTTVALGPLPTRQGKDSSGLDKWSLGAGAGFTGVFAGGMSFFAPTVSLSAVSTEALYLTVSGGWRPMGPAADDPLFPSAPRPPYRNRADVLASVDVSVYPNGGRWGYAFGASGAWKTVRELDNYLERVYGVKGGVRFRPQWSPHLVVGLDLQVSNLSEFGRDGSFWRLGAVPSITVSHLFR